jgi:hypothetical protein
MAKSRWTISLLFIVFIAVSHPAAQADEVRLKPDHPDRYVVAKGDTLWDISAHFLEDPWLWPEVWHMNPEIKNPHLIYPGDVIRLIYVDGKPKIVIDRGTQPQAEGARPTVRLSPRPIVSQLESAIPTIPLDAIEQFLKRPRIVSESELDSAGYIVASHDGHLISGSGDKVYARAMQNTSEPRFNIVRPGAVYHSPKNSKDLLGYEVLDIADANLLASGDPSTLQITHATREVLVGDRLLPVIDETGLDRTFVPHAPQSLVNGQIIAVLDGVSRIGQYHTVVLDKGLQDNLEVGHVLAVYQTGETAQDRINPKMGRTVRLPDERAGTIMVVRLFDRVSYALVMESTRDIRVLDRVTNP